MNHGGTQTATLYPHTRRSRHGAHNHGVINTKFGSYDYAAAYEPVCAPAIMEELE